ncbi:glycosyltransferase family 9 protein [Microlunatus flavus]|uniref:ADP-heptose:LPS heptosyltransferase n=1 Tax=Microlunatus flavus TaxID=1036181 RepID=A0A1H8ZJT9_9ACTN|nr:glycosyltransferase family 9 protein [Microlunatus flavus]SEP64692.1 ADP-heptose:LPS heptosyltransferase [Microlunatus flavus]
MSGTADARPVALVLRALGLGDLLVAVPALRALRRARPEHHVVLAAPEWLRPVVGLTGAVDALLPVAGLEPLPYVGPVDLAVNLHGAGPQSHALLDALRPRERIGHAAPGWDGPPWVDNTLERFRWIEVLRHHGLDGDPADVAIARPAEPSPAPGAVVVHVGAAFGSRSWPAERFAAVVAALAADRPVVLTGSAAERERAAGIAAAAGMPDAANLAGRTDLGALAALVAQAALVVSVDTGAAHLATAYGTPSVVLFGPAPPSRWGPPPAGPHVVLTDESVRRGDAFGDEPDPALLAVGVDDVLAAARRLLA